MDDVAYDSVWIALLLALQLAACGSPPSQPVSREQEVRLLLWEVTSPAAPGVLHVLGSVHVGREPIRSFDPAIEEAFAHADGLVVEVDLSPESEREARRYTLAGAVLSEGLRLPMLIGPDLHARLGRALGDLGAEPDAMDGFRPWYAHMALVALAIERHGYARRYGVDRTLFDRAWGSKRIEALESAQSQIDLFREAPPAIQERLLAVTLERLDELPELLAQTERSWRIGDDEALLRLVYEDRAATPQLEPLHRQLYDDRNRSMAAALAARLEMGGRWLAVVGAGHVVGPEGIPARLASRGFRVRRVAPAADRTLARSVSAGRAQPSAWAFTQLIRTPYMPMTVFSAASAGTPAGSARQLQSSRLRPAPRSTTRITAW